MSDFARINGPRVDKLIEALTVIEKSARSQRMDPHEVRDLLNPVFHKLLVMTGHAVEPGPVVPAPSAPPPAAKGSNPPTWATIREMAEQAPLPDLTVALAVYLNRIDEHLNR